MVLLFQVYFHSHRPHGGGADYSAVRSSTPSAVVRYYIFRAIYTLFICRGFPWLDNLLSVSSRGYYYLIYSDACLTNVNDYLLRDTKKRAFRRVFGRYDWIIGVAILRRLCRFGRTGILVLELTGRWLSIRLRQSVFCFSCPTTIL